jgi:hypothetical protein
MQDREVLPTDDKSYKKESRLTVAQWHRRVTLARHVLQSATDCYEVLL